MAKVRLQQTQAPVERISRSELKEFDDAALVAAYLAGTRPAFQELAERVSGIGRAVPYPFVEFHLSDDR